MNGIRYADTGDIPAMKRIWESSFEGDALFSGWFFARMFKPNDTSLVCEEDGQSAAMLHMLTMDYACQGKAIPAAYIFGVATLPAQRGKGIAAGLIARSLTELRARNIALATLVPQSKSLFAYYGRFDFIPLFQRVKNEVALPAFRAAFDCYWIGTQTVDAALAGELNALFESAMQKRGHMRRSSDHWGFVSEAERLFDGGLYVQRRNGKLTGYAVCERDGDALLIKELFALCDESTQALTRAVMEQHHVQTASLFLPSDALKRQDFGMARAVDIRLLLETLNLNAELPPVNVKDILCPWNHGIYGAPGSDIPPAEATQSQFLRHLLETSPAPYLNLVFD